jgi:tRNA threonylcarbamoyladenosine biosynthesis protein TsaE
MTPIQDIVLADEAATVALAHRLARLARPGDVFALEGDLGSGKTTLARAFVRALTTDDEEVPSPTFTLVQTYESRAGMIWHFDLYRLERADEVLELGIEDAFGSGISLIEWPARLGPWLPAGRLCLSIRADAEGVRHVSLVGDSAWFRRLDDAGREGADGER